MMSTKLKHLSKLYMSTVYYNSPFLRLPKKQIASICTSVNRRRKLKPMEIMRGKKEKILIDADKFGDTFGNLGWLEKQHTNVVEDPEDTTEYKRQKKAKGKFISEYIKEIKDCLDKHNVNSIL